ncbi:FecR family protein [Fibrella aquatilis]|uniref:FecR domain-containing protein n=1 Tax=Fibrella aquatilis TaxID=2817059 RepID=A0A939G3Z3_9BACT|nr:FecR domain-containing protein [Fibrella aquatilis]MBO0931932.1 FecR domain-containing protein [Fibrella aquatilis]
MKSSVTKQLLMDYYAGRVTALQKQLIDDWLREPANEPLFYACLHERELAQVQYEPDLSAALARYQTFLYQQSDRVITDEPATPTTRGRRWHVGLRFWSIAATIVLLLGVSGWLFREPMLYHIYRTAYGETRSVQLTDGSRVILNANTRLLVPRLGFGAGTRTVRVVGEARFTIVHTPDHQPFVVETGPNLTVTVLGTEFAVFARPRATRVVLMRGKVAVNYQPGGRPETRLTLQPGDMVTLDGSGKLHRQTLPKPEQQTAWTDHQFVFNNTSLREVGAMIQETFGLVADIKGERLAQQTLSGSFDAHTADEVLTAVAEVLDIRYIRKNNRVIFRSKTD